MERAEILATMSELKLYGMKAAFDEIITTAVKRQHEPQRVVGDLLTAEITEKQARSIKYQIAIAKLPLAKDIDDFHFDNTPVNETVCRFAASPSGGSLRDGSRSRAWGLPGTTAQRRADWRHRYRQDASGDRGGAGLHPRRRTRAVLQCC
jgi:hypothetical protein